MYPASFQYGSSSYVVKFNEYFDFKKRFLRQGHSPEFQRLLWKFQESEHFRYSLASCVVLFIRLSNHDFYGPVTDEIPPPLMGVLVTPHDGREWELADLTG